MTQDMRGNKDERPELGTQHLTSYQSVAKAIFVRANGLIAYENATGASTRLPDERPVQHHERASATTEFRLAYVPSKRRPRTGSTGLGQVHALSKGDTTPPGTPVSADRAGAMELDAGQRRETVRLGIGFDGRYYRYRSYRYDKLSDAFKYAELESGRPGWRVSDRLSQWLEPQHPTDAEQVLMQKFGVTFDGKFYSYEGYRYERCIDAANYAKSQLEPSGK